MPTYLLKSLDAVASTGPGSELNFDSPRYFGVVSLQVFFTGSPSDVEVNLEGTLDGVTWNSMGNWHSPENPGLIASIGVSPVLGLRANLVSLTGGTSPTVTALIATAPLYG